MRGCETFSALLSQQQSEAGGSLSREVPVRAESSPVNDEADQDCQMVRARQARRKGAREEPAAERLSREPPARTWRIGAGLQRAPV